MGSDFQVVVIGSGIAGIAACKRLGSEGVKVMLLEAQDRFGGRLKTVSRNGNHYDLGASWMHETLTNPLFKMALDKGMEMTYDDVDMRVCVYGDDNVLKGSHFKQIAADITDMADIDYGQGKPRIPDMSLKEYCLKFVEERPMISEKDKQLVPRYMQFYESWCALSWEVGSASAAIPPFFGRDAFVIGGYETVYKWIFDEVDFVHVQVRLNTPVISVAPSQDQPSRFCVTTESGEVYTADYVLCTIPLGVLIEEHKSLFPMELPADLRNAMETSTMGKMGKVCMEFDDRFWDDEMDQAFVFVDRPPREQLPMEPGNFPVNIINSLKRRPQPALLFLITPPLTEYLEANPERAFEFLRPALEKIRVDKTAAVPAPSKVLVTDWTQNPYFRGSYASDAVGADFEKNTQAFVNGAEGLRFAGEHTAFEGPGCAHGAYIEGLREAEIILDLLKESQGKQS